MDYEIKRFTLEEARGLIRWTVENVLDDPDNVARAITRNGLPIIDYHYRQSIIMSRQALIDSGLFFLITIYLDGEWAADDIQAFNSISRA